MMFGCSRSLFDEVAARRWAPILAVGLSLLGAACGGETGTSKDSGKPGDDVGADVMDVTDAGTDAEPTPDPDAVGGDVDEDTGGGMSSDAGDAGDAGSDTDAGPGCQIDEKNTEVDRDRDGLRDHCDHFKYLNHGGDNPEQATTIDENEKKVSNDDANEGEAYDFELPVKINGKVGPVEDDGDIDYYSIEVDEPTALLVRVEPKGAEFWPGAAMFGYEFRNQNKQLILYGGQKGTAAEREMFLPVPGKYSLAISDVRNFLPDNQTPDVPTSGNLGYEVHFSEVPLPALEQVSLPDSTSTQKVERLHVHEVDASMLDGLKVSATGVPIGQNSFHSPGIAIYDPKSNRTLSYTIGQQVDSDTDKVELTTKLDKAYDEVYVIEDIVARFGQSSSKIEFASATVDSEFETLQKPQDERADDLVWMQPGQSVDGEIGPPRMASQTSLSPDVDFYLVSALRGEAIEVTVKPKSGSQLQPELAVGQYLARNGGGSYFTDSRGHTIPNAENAGDARTVRFYYNSMTDGEVGIRVAHAPNANTDNPVGGSNYGYTIEVKKWTPSPATISSIPGQGQSVVKPGGLGVFEFQANKGKVVEIDAQEPNGVSFFERVRLTRRSDHRGLVRDFSNEIAFIPEKNDTYWFDIRDYRGRGTDGKNVTVDVNTRSVQDVNTLPAKPNGMLGSGSDVDYYRFSAQKGDKLDLRLHAASFNGRIDLMSVPAFDRVAVGFGDEVYQADYTGEYIVKVSSSGSNGGSYTLGIQKIQASGLGSVPITKSDKVDDQPFPDWYKFKADKGKIYELSLTNTGDQNFDPRAEIFNGANLDRIEGGGEGTVRFRTNFAGDAYVVVYDADQAGSANFTYDVGIEEKSVTNLTTGQTTQAQLADGSDDALFLFSAGAGAVDVDVQTTGAWTAEANLLEAKDLDGVSGVTEYDGQARYASSEMDNYAVSVEATDSMLSGPLSFEITVETHATSGNTSESEPNNQSSKAQKLTTLPAAVTGTLGKSGDSDDYFEVDLQSGQRVWLMAIPKKKSLRTRMRPKLTLTDPSGSDVADDTFGGYGFFPALHAERADQTGTWSIRLQQRSNTGGDYILYVFTGETFSATEQEPNDNQGQAQQLGEIDAPARISATVDASDATDIYRFKLRRPFPSMRIYLEGANPGHDLRLLDASFSEIAADGPNHGGSSNPELTPTGLAAGTYFLEVKQGNGGGSLNAVIWPEL